MHDTTENIKRPLGFNLSASTINSFHECPWSWSQKKILNRVPPSDPSPYLVLGNTFHKLIESFYEREYNLGTWNTKWLFTNWNKFFKIQADKEGVDDNSQVNFIRMTGFSMLKNWIEMAKSRDWLQDPMIINKKPGVELRFKFPYDNDYFEANLTGSIDMLMEAKNKISIIDWKSGKYHDNYKIQGLIYSSALYKQYGIIEDEVLFVHPAKKQNKIHTFSFKDEDYVEVKEKIDDLLLCVKEKKFEKKKNDNCKYCPWVECENNKNKNLKDRLVDVT